MRFVMGNSKLPTLICIKVFAVSLVARVSNFSKAFDALCRCVAFMKSRCLTHEYNNRLFNLI